MAEAKKVKIATQITAKLKKRLDQESGETGISITHMIERACWIYLESRQHLYDANRITK